MNCLLRASACAVALLTFGCAASGQTRPAESNPNARAPLSAPTADPNAFRVAKPQPGPHSAVKFPTPSMKVLSNGLALWVVPKHSAVATLSVVVRHGGSSVAAGKSGLAALTARMLTEGTDQHSSLALAEATESLGSILEADAGRDESHVSLATLTSDVPRGLELLAEVVFKPAFRPAEFARVKDEWLDGLRGERQEPARLASLVALRVLLGPSAGAPVSGSIPDVEKLTVRDLVQFHRRAYVPASMAVIAVGELTLSELEPKVERLFGSLQGPRTQLPLETPPAPNPAPLRVMLVDRKDAVQASVFAVQSFPKRSEPGFEAREILGTLLGGLFTSRLNSNLRERHAFTYGVHGQALATRQWGAFFVATNVKTESTADALSELVSELDRAQDPKRGAPITEAEAARARADLMHSLGARLEHTASIADAMRTLFAENLPPDYYSKYPDLIARIPTARVAEEAARLDPQHLLVVIVGDRTQLQPSLKEHGYTLETVDPKLLE